MKTSQISNVFLGKMQVFNVIDNLLQTGADGITAVAGVAAVKGVKYYNIAVVCFKISLHHCHFIQIS